MNFFQWIFNLKSKKVNKIIKEEVEDNIIEEDVNIGRYILKLFVFLLLITCITFLTFSFNSEKEELGSITDYKDYEKVYVNITSATTSRTIYIYSSTSTKQ